MRLFVFSDGPATEDLAERLHADGTIDRPSALLRGNFDTVIIPSHRPDLVPLAAARGKSVAIYHSLKQPVPRTKVVALRAAFAYADQCIVEDDADCDDAVRHGADPDRVALADTDLRRRFEHERRRVGLARRSVEAATSVALDAAEFVGAIRLLETVSPHRGVNVVNYHRVLPVEEARVYGRPQMAISAPAFRAQLEIMSERRGFAPVDRLNAEEATGKVVVTFDDGYEDNFRVAFPILQTLSVPACIFIVINQVGRADALWWDKVSLSLYGWWRSGAPAPLPASLPEGLSQLKATESEIEARSIITNALTELNKASEEARAVAVRDARALLPEAPTERRTMLTWEEVQAMNQAGITFGSHTLNHTPLDELERSEAERELFGGHEALDARLGPTRYRTTAVPRGRLGPLQEDELETHFDSVMTTVPGVHEPESNSLFIRRRDGRMLTLFGRHHPAKLRLELTGLVDGLRARFGAKPE